MKLADRLYTKGWSVEELEHLRAQFQEADARRHVVWRAWESSMYWIFLLSLIIGIVGFSNLFLPLLSLVNPLVANLTTAFVAGVFALLFGHVLHDLDHLETGHHVLMLFVAAIAAVGSPWLVLARSLAARSFALGILFAVSFTVFYCYYWWRFRVSH